MMKDEQFADAVLNEITIFTSNGKLEGLQHAATLLMERLGAEVAMKYSGLEAMDAFTLASDFDQYVTSVVKRHSPADDVPASAIATAFKPESCE